MKLIYIALIATAVLVPFAVKANATCPPEGYTNNQLLELRRVGFAVADSEKRNTLALGLINCVSEPDPDIRDGVAFEGISTWLRANDLSAETIGLLYTGLLKQIVSTDDAKGFQQPFAALILSEVARTDRIDPWLSALQRAELVDVAAEYLGGVTDYRGFSETQGWRHGVAHGSDLVLQLALNSKITAEQILILAGAIANQVAPAGAVFYIYGEPGRLARALFYLHMQGKLEASAWEQWFEKISSPAPFDSWGETYSSQAGLAKRHNTLAFLQALHFITVAARGERAAELGEITLSTLETVVNG
jgi:hypothetical protein